MSVLTLNVDEVKRTLSAESSNPFVVHDKEVDIVRFAINSGFADIVLDGQVALRVMYQRPGETEVRAQTLTYYDTDGLHNYYDWQLSQSDLAKNGSLMVALCILDISGGEVSEWHTTPCAVLVLSTIHTDDSDEGDDTITPTVKERVAVLETMIQRVASGAPIVVSSASAMTDTDQIYVLSTNGKWYYHNGSSWVAGGTYGAVATDTTLTQAGIPADAKAVGDAINAITSDVEEVQDALEHLDVETDPTLSIEGKPADAKVVGDEIADLKSDLSDLSNYTYSTNYINNFQQGYRHGRTNCAPVVNSVWVISAEPITFRAGTTLKSIDPNTWVFSIVDPVPENNGQIIVNPRYNDYVFDTDTTGYVECRLRSSENLTPEVANNDIVCGVYAPLIINKINALDKNINVINAALTSNKNLWTGDASLSFIKSKTVTIDPALPAGTYTLSALITSDDTDDTKCRFQINNSSTTKDLGRGTRANGSFTFASEITSVTFYAATNSTKSTGDSATWEDIQIETGSSATPYVAHKMTALDDTAREAVTRLSKYVSTTGSDNNDGNTPATAYATIEKALTECADTIYVAKGTYNENVITEKTWYRYRGLRLICDHAVMIATQGLHFRFCNLHISGLTVDLTDSESSTSYGFLALNCTGDFKDCEVIGATGAGGFRLDGSKMTLTRCKAHDCAIDGFNAHNANTGYNSDCSFIDCEAYSNGDDGLSFHETSHIRVIGGRFYDNISTGIAPHQNCDFEIRNAYIYGNGTGIEAENPNYSSGDEKSEGLIIGCVISANNKTGRAQSNHIGYGVRAKQYIIMALANAVVDNDSGTYYQDNGGQIAVLPIASA